MGAGGFIGGHLVKRLKTEGFWVRGVDIKNHEYTDSAADQFLVGDLRDPRFVSEAVADVEIVYQLAAELVTCLPASMMQQSCIIRR